MVRVRGGLVFGLQQYETNGSVGWVVVASVGKVFVAGKGGVSCVALEDGGGVGAVVCFSAVMAEVVFSELPEDRSFMGSASEEVMPSEIDNSVGLEVGAVTTRDKSEVGILVCGGVADGVFDGGGELVLEFGVGCGYLNAVEGEWESSGANKHGFATVGEWEVLDAVYHGDGKPESGVEGSGSEKAGHVDVGSKVPEVVSDNNATVADGPNVVFELLASVWGGREDHAFVSGDSSSEVMQVGVSEGDLFDEVLNVVGPGSGVEEVVR